MDDKIILEIISILDKKKLELGSPVFDLIKIIGNDPFKILISTIISLRTRDEITIQSSKKLFKFLKSPNDIINISVKQISEAIYPCGFYNRKSIQIKQICISLINNYDSKIPDDLETLLTFKGIGRKTANLILSRGFNIPAICVDTHVHRISNRFGYIKTKTPEQSEFKLMNKLPKKYWINYNLILVALGQSICKPINPKCDKCPISKLCEKIIS